MSEKAFSESFCARLASGKYTQWAADLSEDTLRALLWIVGEYGVRVDSIKEPIDRTEPDNLH